MMNATKRIVAAIVSPPIIVVAGGLIAVGFLFMAVWAPFYFLFAADPFKPRDAAS